MRHGVLSAYVRPCRWTSKDSRLIHLTDGRAQTCWSNGRMYLLTVRFLCGERSYFHHEPAAANDERPECPRCLARAA